MTLQEYNELADEIEHRVRMLVDDHPLTRGLSLGSRRNMAYCAGHSAMSALTADDLGFTPPPQRGEP